MGPDGELAGFARGVPHHDIPGYNGELNKIYILRRYHRLGLGRRLLGDVSRRFLANGIDSMLLFGDARNPSNGFYERMGAERIFAPNGDFHGGYGWRDIRPSRCSLLIEAHQYWSQDESVEDSNHVD